ncbi:MAG: alanine--tRNA ligase [Patescibacteria group bacterium]
MNSQEICKRFLEFFRKRGHAILPSASLVPENDPSVLFTTAGMQPLVPYLLGTSHPQGKRLANVQKCVRTQDIDEVGDNTHDTFFEMLGNWSLGDYFKEGAIKWSYEFLTSKEEGLGLDPHRLYITVFEGDSDAPRDDESAEIWMKLGISAQRIYFLPKKFNWWSLGDNGPCGPDTEMFYDITENGLGNLSKEEFLVADARQNVVEIWNDVFMEYEKKEGKVVSRLKQRNVDTGAGLERLAMVMQGKSNIFETDLFTPIMQKINEFTSLEDVKAKRIIADHIRTSVFLIADGVIPSNTDSGYVLRRLIRRTTYYCNLIGLKDNAMFDLVNSIIDTYQGTNYGLKPKEKYIKETIQNEEIQFRKTLESGKKQAEKIIKTTPGEFISGEDAFSLFSTYGYPLELTIEIAFENGKKVNVEGFWENFKKHQELSRSGALKKFKGGLADHSEMSVKYHTATHLLHRALRVVLGIHVFQKGSNITPERLRFDFSHSAKMTDEEKKKVEDIVNAQIQASLPVSYEDLLIKEAEKQGAIGLFEEKYGDKVRVYQIGEGGKRFSLEFCGGPHVSNTGELGVFKITKEEAVSAGVRRIKAILIRA